MDAAETMGDIPSPGSAEALAAGCMCAILDNAHGHGYMGIAGMWCITHGCSLHHKTEAS